MNKNRHEEADGIAHYNVRALLEFVKCEKKVVCT